MKKRRESTLPRRICRSLLSLGTRLDNDLQPSGVTGRASRTSSYSTGSGSFARVYPKSMELGIVHEYFGRFLIL